MTSQVVLVVEDDPGLREAVVDTLMLSDYECIEADSGEAALVQLKKHQVDMVVSDVQMGNMSGLTLLKNIKANSPDLPVLIMTAYATIDDAVQAMKDGACNYIAKPFVPEVLLNMISQYMPVEKVVSAQPIAVDEHSKQLLKLAKRVAATDASVMILGPSGSGKEVLSQFIHNESLRAEQTFVAINCAAIPENMLEATLFGYEKGAFTGAVNACPGKFEQAQGGTILLDEITEMDLSLQAKILRVIQEKEVERLGGRKTIKLDVRVIATSNRDLKQAVAEGVFREDLFYRLNVFPLTWLPLCKRVDDILPLSEHIINLHSPTERVSFTASAQNKLLSYSWPGNVRELDNVIQRALIMKAGADIDSDDLLIEDFIMDSPEPVTQITHDEDNLESELKQQEFQIILDALRACNGSRKEVAERLGISARTLRYKLAKMRENGIQLPV
ncbi:sigma-54-dependent transcriptional regulator [Thalassomonas sp. M1454]|uniref:sigma-54-dependent transcriptional regulator n=1 Tax=Thalassomonas sp. M1454 TaxID=2594477 RepID=UPI00117DF306|nr:sigma-54 dependent transcriptional regulator [Thalassomonas sp. M1454]TRX57424.1 sigma-54-dependent Fis family transcriptional regulator [Thalassomonas sp. M1454]